MDKMDVASRYKISTQLSYFIDDCISCGKVLDTNLFELTHSDVLLIETILNESDDTTSRHELNKILKPYIVEQ